jgi:preprotein translocase subunit SecG
MIANLLMVALFSTALFLILLVLVQRGKGGGLSGALGGMGGQSAFGTKAGDMFTKITVVVAAVWIVLCVFSGWALESSHKTVNVTKTQDASADSQGTGQPGDSVPVGGAPGDE